MKIVSFLFIICGLIVRYQCNNEDLVDVCYTSAENKPEHCQYLDFDDVVEKSGYLLVGHAIKKLTISNKKILNIPNRIFKSLHNLQSFIIVNCVLYRDIDPNSIKDETILERLEISLTNATKLDSKLFPGARGLKRFFLHHNQISKIEKDAFYYFGKLEEINLSYNKLTHLDDGIFIKNEHIKSLDLNHNQIAILNYDGWFDVGESGSHYLAHLDMSFNAVSEVYWNELPAKVINLKYNQLTEIQLDGNCTDLYAAFNKIKRVKVGNSCKLEKLSLASNSIYSIKPIQNCSKTLRSLDISFNFIDPETDFFGMDHLVGLNLECTNITIAYKTLVHLRKLKSLDLSYNNISSLSEIDLTAQKMLERLTITGNPLTVISVDQLRKDFPRLNTLGIYDLGWNETTFTMFLDDLKNHDIKPYIKSDYIFEESQCPLKNSLRDMGKDGDDSLSHEYDEVEFHELHGNSKIVEYIIIAILVCIVCAFSYKTFIRDNQSFHNPFRSGRLTESISNENLVHCDLRI